MAAKLFLGGLAPETQKEDLEAHFGQYGNITDSVVMMKDGRPRGFGFVTFEDGESADLCLAEEQVLHNRVVDVKLAVPGDQVKGGGSKGKGKSGGSFVGGGSFGGGGAHHFGGGMGAPLSFSSGAKGGGKSMGKSPAKGGGKGAGGYQGATDKVFVGGLASITTDDTLSAYFSRYGQLVDVIVMKDRETSKSRGFGFVQYDNTESVEQVMAEYQTHEIDGKWIEVKKSIPKEEMPAAGAPKGGKSYGGGKGCGHGMGMGGGYKGAPAPAFRSFGGGYGGVVGAYISGGGKGGAFRPRPY